MGDARTRNCLIEVGTPVARRPPHRSRRAVFPHRALQSCSLRTDPPWRALFAIPRREVCMSIAVLRACIMFPLRAAQPCRSLPPVIGSPVPEYASLLSFIFLFLSKRQHLVRVVDYSLPGRDSHPARGTKLRLAHTIPDQPFLRRQKVRNRQPLCYWVALT